MNSQMVSDPLTKFMFCSPGEGAVALLLASGKKARELGLVIDFRQTNHEGTLVDWLHEAHVAGAKAVIINAAAYTHTSVALLDAAKAITPPVIEVHLSNPQTREDFRHVSYIGEGAVACFKGKGLNSYIDAIDAAAAL